MKISEILNTGKSTKLSFKKSLTYPNAILSYRLQLIPARSIAAQKPEKVENFSTFLIAYINIKTIAKTAKIIKNSFEFSNKLNAAPVFCTYIKSNISFCGSLNLK